MTIALTVVHVIMCFSIIGIVLLQAGKGADIGSAFGGAGSQAVFGSMGTPTILGKITTVVAVSSTGLASPSQRAPFGLLSSWKRHKGASTKLKPMPNLA